MRASLPALVARQEIDAEFVQLAGALFRREWLPVVRAAPACTRWVRSWDLAFTEKTSSDYTAGALVGFGDGGGVIIKDMVRGRWEWPEAVARVRQTALDDGPGVQQGVEVVGAQVGFLQTLQREPALAGIVLRPVEVHRDKLTRVLPVVARAEQGKLVLVEGHWNHACIDEFCAFPESEHDDQVDAVSGALQLVGAGETFAVAIT